MSDINTKPKEEKQSVMEKEESKDQKLPEKTEERHKHYDSDWKKVRSSRSKE